MTMNLLTILCKFFFFNSIWYRLLGQSNKNSTPIDTSANGQLDLYVMDHWMATVFMQSFFSFSLATLMGVAMEIVDSLLWLLLLAFVQW